jgi:hypothetical protein
MLPLESVSAVMLYCWLHWERGGEVVFAQA